MTEEFQEMVQALALLVVNAGLLEAAILQPGGAYPEDVQENFKEKVVSVTKGAHILIEEFQAFAEAFDEEG